jgi:hypothetical protein
MVSGALMMLSSLRSLLAQLGIFNTSLGDVLFETPSVKGRSAHSCLQWRVKKGWDNSSLFITLKVRPDAEFGLAGAMADYLSFDLTTAEQIKADLDRCITEYRRIARTGLAPQAGRRDRW